MFRVFRDGDVIVTREIPGSSAVPGDVIVFTGASGSRVVHRVISRQGNMLTTMGDNNPAPDSDPVDASASLQLVTGFIRRRKEYSIGRGKMGMVVFRCNRVRRSCRRGGSMIMQMTARILPGIPVDRCRSSFFNGVEHFRFCGFTVARRFADGRLVFTGWYWRLLFSMPENKKM